MNTRTIINHLCDRYGARSYDLNPWTRVWKTRSGHTYCIKPSCICHRNPKGDKRNYRGSDPIRFIDEMERVPSEAHKHAAMDIMPNKETIAMLSHARKPENAVPSHKPAVLSRANALYSVERFMVFKSPDMPGVVDVYEIVADKKIRQIASFYRQTDEQALRSAKNFLLTKV